MAGASFDEIAESLDYADRGGAHKAVMAGLQSTLPEPAAQVRELELKRLDRLWLGVWDAATKGDLQSVDTCLRIMKRRADLEGLDAPKKLEHGGIDGGPIPIQLNDEQLIERARVILNGQPAAGAPGTSSPAALP
jgi:hypothetical protein